MKFWTNLAQVFFGIFSGYWISKIISVIIPYSFVGFAAIGLSSGNGGGSFFSFIVSIGIVLLGLAFSLFIGLLVNGLLIMFVPISGVISALISTGTILYFIFTILASFLF